MQEGAIDGLSIGYRTVRGQIDPKTRIRKLYQVDLWEISIVTFPLLAGARVRAVKQAFPKPKLSPLRMRAENEWRGLSGVADTPALLGQSGSRVATRLDTCAGRKLALRGVASLGADARR